MLGSEEPESHCAYELSTHAVNACASTRARREGDEMTCASRPALHLVIIPVAELTFRAERLSDRRGS